MQKNQREKQGDFRERLIQYIKQNDRFYQDANFAGVSEVELVIQKVEIEIEKEK